MVDIKHKKCIEHGCNTRPNFNYEGNINVLYCSNHKKEGMVDIKHKKCLEVGCKIQPSFNYEGLQPEYCSSCKLPDMIMLRKRLCIKCNKDQANFNFFGEKAMFCSGCKETDMINIMNKCKNKNCTNCGNVKYK